MIYLTVCSSQLYETAILTT